MRDEREAADATGRACATIIVIWIVLAVAIGVFLHWVFTNV